MKNNIQLIDKLFINNICYVEEISVFLGNSLLDNWGMLKEANSELKYSRSLNNIRNNIEKLSKLEIKRPVTYSKTIEDNRKILNEFDVDKDYRLFINKKLKSINYIYELYTFLIFEYDKYREKIVVEKSSEPKHEIKYVVDDKGYIYANMDYSQPLLFFSKTSFGNEKWKFYNSLKKFRKLELDIPSELGNKVSPIEKKRRIYINTMYDLYFSINIMLKNDVYFEHPIFVYFDYATTLANYLYKETFEYGRKDNNFNRLWKETIKAYGCSNGLVRYEKLYWNFMNVIPSYDKKTVIEFKLNSDKEKNKKSNILFKDIKGIVPSVLDIYKGFNSLVISKVPSNYTFYVNDLENRIKDSLKYMDVPEMISFYNVFKDAIKQNKGKVDLYIRAQKCVAMMIKDRNNKELDDIITNYLKEEVLYLHI